MGVLTRPIQRRNGSEARIRQIFQTTFRIPRKEFVRRAFH